MNNPKERDFNEVQDLGVAIRTYQGPQQIHIGLLYRWDQVGAQILHLRTHLDLKSEAAAEPFRWIQIDLDETNRRIIVGLCRLIANKCKNVPFGFTYNGVYFTDAGDYLARDLGHGLTCATFVMAVFATYSIELLKTQEWPLAALTDQAWQMGQVKIFRARHGVFIGDAIAAHVGQSRFTPTQVAAGAVHPRRPLSYERAERMAQRIQADLLKSYGGNAP